MTDAWAPQVNGVVRSLSAVSNELRAIGHEVDIVSPSRFRTVPCPTYPEIRLALGAGRAVARVLGAMRADAIHVATEGPLGHAARSWCLATGRAFTSAFHTRFPEYISERFRVPSALGYAVLRRFHRPSASVMVATASLERELNERGFARVKRWSRGVDTALFRPRPKDALDLKRPVFLTVSRAAVEKNLPAFLDLDLPGSKVVVGDGPLLPELRRRYLDVHFPGMLQGEALACTYAAADVFVFPSRTDTFGLVLLEALASGVPVAAFPVAGPRDVLEGSGAGVLDQDLRRAALAALDIDPGLCRAHAEGFSWSESARQFLGHLRPAT